MPATVRALRGATTVTADSDAQVTERIRELSTEAVARNGTEHSDELRHVYFHMTQVLRDDLAV